MFARLISQPKINELETGFLLDTGVIGFGYRCSAVDTELAAQYIHPDVCVNFISSLPFDVTVRMISHSTIETENNPTNGIRAPDLEKVGNVQYHLDVFIEKRMRRITPLKAESAIIGALKELRATFDPNLLKRLGLEVEPITDYEPLFERPSFVRLAPCGLQADSKFYAVLKLVKLGSYQIDLFDMIQAREDLPLPNTLSLSVRKLGDSETQLFLKKKSKQESSGSDLSSFTKYEDVQNSIGGIL